MMYGRGLLARMGDGSVRRVADQYEADRIKRETGDQDMFVFQAPETDDREKEQSPWGPVTGHKKPARRKSLLSPDNEDDATGDKIGNPAASKQQRPQTTFPTNPMAQPLFKSQAKPQGKPQTKSLSGPVTGHAAASLNQDGSTKVRMLDKGLDPAVPVKTKAPANPYQQARTMERKANAPKPRNPYQGARGMEDKAKQASPGMRSQEERDKAYRESRKWLDEHGQKYAREALGIPAPKVKGGGTDPDNDPYRKARKWLAEHGDEKAKKEMEPAARVVGKAAKWTADQAAQSAAEALVYAYFGPAAYTVLKTFNRLYTLGSSVLTPSTLGDSTLEEGWEKKYEKHNKNNSD